MDNQIQNKLFQFEVQPPEGSWGRIADALDDQALAGVGTRLSSYEPAPPENIWNSINTELGSARVVPFHKKYSRPLRYGSAVAIITAFALITNLLISKRTESETPVPITVKNILQKSREQQQQQMNSESPVAVEQNQTEAAERPHDNDNNNENRKTYSFTRKRLSSFIPTVAAVNTSTSDMFPKFAKRNYELAINDDDKYMAFAMEDGNAIRLPKKMYDAITCPTKDVACLQKIKQLQEKMAASALFADFTGVLDIVNNLGENQ